MDFLGVLSDLALRQLAGEDWRLNGSWPGVRQAAQHCCLLHFAFHPPQLPLATFLELAGELVETNASLTVFA